MKKLLIGLTFLSVLFFVMLKIPIWLENHRQSKYKSVDKNGLTVTGTIFSKSTYHGRWVSFVYRYKGATYKNEMQDDYLFSIIDLGDSVNIVLDTTEPTNSFVSSLIH